MKQLVVSAFLCLLVPSLYAGTLKKMACTPISNNSIGTAQTICSGSVPNILIGSLPSGGDGSGLTYEWIISTIGISSGYIAAAGVNNTINYTPTAITQNTWFRRVVSSGICTKDTSTAILITVNYPVTNNTITGTQVVFNGYLPNQLMGSIPSGGNTSYSYLWIVSGSPSGNFDSIRRTNNNGQHYQPDTTRMAYTLAYPPTPNFFYFKYKRIVRSGVCADTSNAIEVKVSDTLYWTGTQDNNWSNSANWMGAKTGLTIVIPSSSTNNPIISGYVSINRLMIGSGKTVSLLDSNSTLYIGDYFYGGGTYNGSMGTTIYDSPQYLQGIRSGTYNKLVVSGGARSEIPGGTVLVKSSFTTGGVDVWGNLILDSNCTYSNMLLRMSPGATLTIRNIGVGGRTGNVVFPVESRYGSCKNVTINNTGIADAFTIQCLDTIKWGGLTGTKITSNTIKNGWLINEGIAGGSNVSLTMQWDTGSFAEYAGFSPSASYIAFYDNGIWNSASPSAALTASGKRTQTRSGLTIFNNTPFGVGSNATLPVRLISFDAAKQNTDVVLTWSTASELNNDYFKLQRSADGIQFETIDRIKGNGTTSNMSNYTYNDFEGMRFNTGKLYYRLVQVDFDGTETVSNIVRMTWADSPEQFSMKIHPNPFADKTSIFVTQQGASLGILKITDIAGRIVLNKTVELNSGTTEIDLAHISSPDGILFITITSNEGVVTQRLLKATE